MKYTEPMFLYAFNRNIVYLFFKKTPKNWTHVSTTESLSEETRFQRISGDFNPSTRVRDVPTGHFGHSVPAFWCSLRFFDGVLKANQASVHGHIIPLLSNLIPACNFSLPPADTHFGTFLAFCLLSPENSFVAKWPWTLDSLDSYVSLHEHA